MRSKMGGFSPWGGHGEFAWQTPWVPHKHDFGHFDMATPWWRARGEHRVAITSQQTTSAKCPRLTSPALGLRYDHRTDRQESNEDSSKARSAQSGNNNSSYAMVSALANCHDGSYTSY